DLARVSSAGAKRRRGLICIRAGRLPTRKPEAPFFRGRAFHGGIIAAVLMGFARQHLFDPSETNVCHCISRCVWREMLLEHEERRTALMNRLRWLTQYFAVDVLEAALMHNHLHLVTSTNPEMARSWSAVEVATRFRTICPDYALRKRSNRSTCLSSAAITAPEPAAPSDWP
ncbi:MAG: hypothetical protein SGJ11_11165, partial [Phycisphaerae bacterium]|nr:hypothetical protein [Phycisphaerae bacterium]